VRDLELRASNHKKHEQIITEISSLRIEVNTERNSPEVNAEINGLKTEINDVKVEIARVQGSIMTLNEKFDLFIQGRLILATPLTQPPNVAVA